MVMSRAFCNLVKQLNGSQILRLPVLVKLSYTEAHTMTGHFFQLNNMDLLSCCTMLLYKFKVLTYAISSTVLQYPDTVL